VFGKESAAIALIIAASLLSEAFFRPWGKVFEEGFLAIDKLYIKEGRV